MLECFCGVECKRSLVPHLKSKHPKEWRTWGSSFVELRNKGLSYHSIINKFKNKEGRFLISSKVVEQEVQRLVEEGMPIKIPRKEKIKEWQPKDFTVNRETFWIFEKRGSWAVHQSDYRGNWSPYIPRSLIEHYSKEGDIVLDPFIGGGTTLIETWLTNRKGVGIDINPLSLITTKALLQEMHDQSKTDPRISLRDDLKPEVLMGDARSLKDHLKKIQIYDNKIKLACLHPPYINSLKYTATIDGDLSHITNPSEFCDQLECIAQQIYDLLKDDGICGVLVGDVKRNGELIPFGFLAMERFLNLGFKLRNIIVKTQHKDSSTRYWYTKRKMVDFLIAHEYLFIFGK